METKRITKKLIASIMVSILILAQFSGYKFESKAAVINQNNDKNQLYLSLSALNTEANPPIGYAIRGTTPKIWNIVSHESANGGKTQIGSNLYCIKAEYGKTWTDNANINGIVTYNNAINLNQVESTVKSQKVAELVNSGNFAKVLWILDNSFIPEDPNEDFDKFLANMGIVKKTEIDEGEEVEIYVDSQDTVIPVLSDPQEVEKIKQDIVAIQQAAIWRYTNSDNEYFINSTEESATWLKYTLNGTDYNELNSSVASQVIDRGHLAMIAYKYFVEGAKNVTADYKLQRTTGKLWLSETNNKDNLEQPIVEIHRKPELFDLALRKAIVAVNGKNVEGNARDLKEDGSINNIDVSKLYKEDGETTAKYKHRKDPVIVETGDTVTYSFTIYNEGKYSGIATEIKDALPGNSGTGLRLKTGVSEVTSSLGNTYQISYNTTENTITLTLKNRDSAKMIDAYDSENSKLSYETIKLDFVVEAREDTTRSKILTNIAYISKEYNKERNIEFTKPNFDKDSSPESKPNLPERGISYGDDMGYTGKTSNPSNLAQNTTYYEGLEDDDDFEKVKLQPKALDLSLRKYITEVDGTELKNNDDRNPNINTETLDEGADTAEYKHKKDPVLVQNGSTVKYNISVYNEGNKNGIATQIVDQLPTGLKLDTEALSKDNSESMYLTSTKGNTYKVTYDTANNKVVFSLEETENTKYLLAYTQGNLDGDTITVQCKVECQAHSTQKTYLTNIAYISAEKPEGGEEIETDRDSQPGNHPENTADELKTTGDVGYTGKDTTIKTENELNNKDKYYEGEQDDDDFEKIVIKPKVFDLKLVKFITKVNEETIDRHLTVDMSEINKNGVTTGKYILDKDPIAVEPGDLVTYTFRIYNEGDYDGYATEISEDIPEGLEAIIVGTNNEIWLWDGKNLRKSEDNAETAAIISEIKNSSIYENIVDTNSQWTWNKDTSILTSDILESQLIKAYNSEADFSDGETKNPDYKELSIVYRVKDDADTSTKPIRNEAAISKDKAVDENGKEVNVSDRDSTPGNNDISWKKENSDKYYDEEHHKWPIYKEDDEDYDNIIVKIFDLSLRKQIVEINDALIANRFATLDTDNSETNTLYDYYDVYGNKKTVKAGDQVVYSIRVYNEGEIDGYAKLIVDTLPSGLEYVSSEYNGVNYGWTKVEGTEKTYQTDYLSYEKDVERGTRGTRNSTLIPAYTGTGEASFKEIYIVCKVKDDATPADSLLNVAQIADDSDGNGKEVKDKDSIPGKTDREDKWKREDDLDIEILQLKEFDLALRKFITEIQTPGLDPEEVTSRIPVVTYNTETKKIEYTHPKDAVTVHVGDIVTYTIRVFNEGDIDGYAAKVRDDLPEYLEYLPENDTNKAYEWKMYDKDGKETTNVSDAAYIETEHLAKGHGDEAGKENSKENLLTAFEPSKEISEANPSHKDVKIAFKVKDPNSNTLEIENFAQISDDTDGNGKPIKDRDSTPGNGTTTPKEDDEDIERVKVEYFDLALLKYVTKVIVIEDGKQTISETGNVGDENDIVPRVELQQKDINKVTVKFAYDIKITNEGDMAGYAKEITDYIPQGLAFNQEDNLNWKDEGNNVISTRALENRLLQPGESDTVEVILTWINDKNNLGSKINHAEISEDDNERKVPDRDSTPDNRVPGEDDIDNAEVLLSIKTGAGINVYYVQLMTGLLAIILVGTVLIKKFVL